MDTIKRVGVVGGGLMGAGIAEVCARHGFESIVVEISSEAAEAAERRVEASLDKGVAREKLTAEEGAAARDRISFESGLGVVAEADLVIEAVVEDRDTKRTLFAELDEICTPGAVLASNTSSIPIVDLATATQRPGAVVGLHFFNPVPVMALVEVVPSLLTGEATVETVTGFAEALGKTVVRAPDRGGFIVNALLIPYLVDAIRLFEGGHAAAGDIDAAMRLGAGHPMGPLTLCDLIGNDTVLAVAESLYAEFADPRHAPPPLLKRMVEGGLLGRKSGRGFYDY